MLTQLFKRQVVSDAAITRLAQVVSFGCACGVPVLAFWKFSRIDMSEAEILIGVLATMSMALQFTLVGLHLETRARAA